MVYSPDNTHLVCGTSSSQSESEKSQLCFFEIPKAYHVAIKAQSFTPFGSTSSTSPPISPAPCLAIVINNTSASDSLEAEQYNSSSKKEVKSSKMSAIFVKWQPATNQIFCRLLTCH